MSHDLNIVNAAVDAALPTALTELAEMIAIPSVAAKSDSPMEEGAAKVAELLKKRGFVAELIATFGAPPVVFAQNLSAGPDKPTVLFYNHYDVQPAEPLDLWDSDPWTLRIDGDICYGRGATDDKGHISARLMAIDALLAANNGTLPVNVKFIVEGEEEVTSLHLAQWIDENRDLLDADVTVWEFGGVDHYGTPEIICGLRGIAYLELHVQTIAYDGHSGFIGSLFENAAWRLIWAINSIKGPDGRILIDGHYAPVIPPDDYDRELMEKLPNIEDSLLAEYNMPNFLGDVRGVEAKIQQVFEPTATVCGIGSGWQGEGAKTVLPANAMAKMDFRLVPDMDPETVIAALQKHLIDHGFADVQVHYLGGQRPGRVDPRHPMVKKCIDTARTVYGCEPVVVPLVGGSGPIYPFIKTLGQPVVTCGVGYPGGRAHAPNENLRISDLLLGAKHTAHFMLSLLDA